MKYLRSFFLASMKVFGCLLVPIALYLVAALVLAWIPTHTQVRQPNPGVEVYLVSNGMHVDICLPMDSESWDWHPFFQSNIPNIGDYAYVNVGWGDKQFYLETPSFKEIRLITAVNAVFLHSPAAMHIKPKKHLPPKGKHTRKISLSPSEYSLLAEYIRASFQYGKDTGIIPVEDSLSLYEGSYFFEAKGSYHLFNTCNNWTNKCLKMIGLKTAIWAPFSQSVLLHFGRE